MKGKFQENISSSRGFRKNEWGFEANLTTNFQYFLLQMFLKWTLERLKSEKSVKEAYNGFKNTIRNEIFVEEIIDFWNFVVHKQTYFWWF